MTATDLMRTTSIAMPLALALLAGCAVAPPQVQPVVSAASPTPAVVVPCRRRLPPRGRWPLARRPRRRRRRQRRRRAAGQPAAICRGDQGRQADRRPDHGLAEGRQALAGTGAGAPRQAVHAVAQAVHRHRRGLHPGRPDGLPGERRRRPAGGGVRARAQHGAAAGAQSGRDRQARHAGSARGGGVLFAQPAGQRRRWPASRIRSARPC